MSVDALLNRLLDALPAAAWAAIGALIAHVWHRYRSRLTPLRWQAAHQPLGVSTQDALFGTVEVRYNGQPVHNLFFTTIDLQNQSNIDLKDVDLNLVFQDGTIIYMAHGAVQGSANMLPFADPFNSDLNRFLELQPQDPNRPALGAALSRRRDFRVPVLNRGASLRIAMLVQAQPGQRPLVNVGCDHAGVRLLFQGPQDLVFGVQRGLAALTGLTAAFAVVVVLVSLPVGVAATAFIALALGSLTAAIGAALVRSFRWLLRMLG